MAYSYLPWFNFRAVDNNGLPISGGKVYTYQAGTEIPLAVHSDFSGSTHTNPITLDAKGEAMVLLDTSKAYKFKITYADGSNPKTFDNVTAGSGGGGGNGNFVLKTGDTMTGALVFDASGLSQATQTVFSVKKDETTNWLRMRGDGTLAMAKAEVDNIDVSNIQVGDFLDVNGLSRFNTNGADYGASINVGHGATSAGWIITQFGGWEYAGLYVLGGTHNGKPYYTYGTHFLFIAQVGSSWFWFIHDELIANGNTAYTTATARQLIGGTNSDYLPSASSFYIQNGAYTGQNASASYEEGSNLGISTNSIQVREGSGAGKILLSDASGKGSWNDPSVFNSNFITTSTAQSGLTGDKSTSGVWSFLGGISFPTNQGITNSGTMPYSATTHKWDSGISGSTAKYQFGGGDVEVAGHIWGPNTAFQVRNSASYGPILQFNPKSVFLGCGPGTSISISNQLDSYPSAIVHNALDHHRWDAVITGSTAKYRFGGGNAEFVADVKSATIDTRNGMKISGNWADGSSLKVPVDGQITNSGTSGSNYASGLYFAGGTAYFKAINSAGDTGFIQLGNNTFNLSLKDLANVLDITSSHFNTNTPSLNWQTTGTYSLNSTGALSLTSGAQINLASATYASYNATTYHKWDSGISGSTAKYQFSGQVHALSYGMTNALSALTPNTDTSSRIQAGVQDNTVSSLSDGGTKARVIHVQAGASGDGYSHQLGLTDNGNMWMRSGASGGTTWGAWKKVWSENNFDPATKANLSGASFTGAVSAKSTYAAHSYYNNFFCSPADGSAIDSGLVIGALGANNALVVSGAYYYSGGQWVAKSTTASGIAFSGGDTIFYANTGLTVSGTYSPTERFRVGANGVVSAKAFASGSNGISTITGATTNVDISTYGVWYHTATLTGAVTLNMNAGAQAGLSVKIMFRMPATAVSYTLAYSGVYFNLCGSGTQTPHSITIPASRFTNDSYAVIELVFFSTTGAFVLIHNQ